MKLYKGLMGAAGVAASLGLFAYASHDAVYEESETEEFPEEEPEYGPELPAEKAAPYAQEDDPQESEEKYKNEQNPSGNKKEKRRYKNPAYRPAFPKLSNLEKTLKEEEEKPGYDLPPEEREEKSESELEDYFYEALFANDFKVAESYMIDLELRNPGEYKHPLSFFTVCAHYNYLEDIITNCDKYDYDSVFRKVIWINIFIYEHPEMFPISGNNNTQIIPSTFFNKGNLALEAVEYCIEKRTP
ncbi:MAG: hypothetical protein AABW53_02995 [Nanoarchaeota archaeon]